MIVPRRDGLVAVYAMARPGRPDAERVAVLAAAGDKGSIAQRAARLASKVAIEAMNHIDMDPGERILALLAPLAPSPIEVLATDPEIDTARLIQLERIQRMEARGGQRLAERQWAAEDRAILAKIVPTLAERYRKHLRT